MLTAWQGNPTEAARLIEAATADGISRGEGRVLGMTGYAAAVLYNGLGRYEEALTAARTVCEYEDIGFYRWCSTNWWKPRRARRTRSTAEAAESKLAERAGASGTDWGLGALASAQAMLADDTPPRRCSPKPSNGWGAPGSACTWPGRTCATGSGCVGCAGDRCPQHLTEAYEMFVRMGAQAFAERARRELAATGEKVRGQPAVPAPS